MSTLFAIAKSFRQVYGHGDSGEELAIRQEGAYYGKGDFPPLFRSRHEAAEWMNVNEILNAVIVELEFYEPEEAE